MRSLHCTHPLLPSHRVSRHAGGLGSPDRVLPVAPHTQAAAGWVGNGGLALCTSVQLGLSWVAAAQAASAEASERLEVRLYTNTRCFSSRLMSAYPRHKLSPTYTEGRQPSFPRTPGALLTHSREGLGGRRRDSIIGDPLENAEAKPAAPGNHSSTQSINSRHPLTYSINKPSARTSSVSGGARHLVCSKHAMLQ